MLLFVSDHAWLCHKSIGSLLVGLVRLLSSRVFLCQIVPVSGVEVGLVVARVQTGVVDVALS